MAEIAPVVGMRHVVEADHRLGPGVGRAQRAPSRATSSASARHAPGSRAPSPPPCRRSGSPPAGNGTGCRDSRCRRCERTKAAASKWLVAPRPGLEEQPFGADQRLREQVELRIERDRLQSIPAGCRAPYGPAGSARRPAGRRRPRCRARVRCAAGPMPDSISSFGELIDEAATITSRRALTT